MKKLIIILALVAFGFNAYADDTVALMVMAHTHQETMDSICAMDVLTIQDAIKDSIGTMDLKNMDLMDAPVTSTSYIDPETNYFAWIADINFFQIILITVLCIITIYVIKIYKKLS